MMNLKVKGFALGAIAAATYGMNPLFTLPLYSNGMNPDSVLFFRYLLALPIVAVMLKARGHSLKLQRQEVLPLVVMGVLMAASSLCLYLSYNYMAAGIASTMLFVYPIMVALIMALVYKERLSLMTAFCLVMALGGIGMLYNTSDGGTLSLAGTLLVMLSSLSYAIYLVGVNKPVLKNIPTLRVTFYVLLFGVFLYVIRLVAFCPLTVPTDWYLWGNLIALAILPTAISFFCTTLAIQYIGSTPTAILGALEPVTAIFFGVVVFDETLTPRDIVGLVMIITAVTLVVAGGSVTLHLHLTHFRKLFPKIPFGHHHKAE